MREPAGTVSYNRVRKYYSAFGRNVAVREVAGGTGAGVVRFLLTDHLGGTAKTMNSSGTIVDSIKYWPFGAMRSGTATTTDKLFTGQRQEAAVDPALGLYDYNARFYSTTLGRFVSADPVSDDGLSRYTYVSNNPLVLVDPTGYDGVFMCGYGDDCTTATELLEIKAHVVGYWDAEGYTFGGWDY
jgi:RHS repeat-associated protein